ncbi:hypothetical protein [Stackebrandtia nassauensis]|uniref:Uncharacterized protein n=1 Tax=Stackebrandtia nassauensis (strain DSM 44728 / CIP 108903 / NRRL B-16338 / NBRC 102104 / LLR-40K-21) TaxID=446470 RepID=D3Q4F2_STANL|nr:hypothetical protein [Stackebrandtia nassauensis]ADD40112.1 hypothetical protein Snas_0395 [Stackebrandtia nassauensis DSM 44728]
MPPPPPTDGRFEVDVDAIEDFQPTFNRLDSRVSTASGKVSPASAEGLGTFTDAMTVIRDHDRLRATYLTRLEMLRAAVAIANTKTTRLIANYRGTESTETSNMTALLGPLANVIQQIARKD